MEARKRFPADTSLKVQTFLNNKKVNGELYAFLQSLSRHSDEVTFVLKEDLPKQGEICSYLKINSPKTYRAHLNYLIEFGFVEELVDRYILPRAEDIYLLIPQSTIQYLRDNCKDHIFKIYIYLAQRFKWAIERGSSYVFTLEELGNHVGIKVKNNSRGYEIINNALDLLYNSGLIDYITFFDGQTQRKKLIKFSFDVNRNG